MPGKNTVKNRLGVTLLRSCAELSCRMWPHEISRSGAAKTSSCPQRLLTFARESGRVGSGKEFVHNLAPVRAGQAVVAAFVPEVQIVSWQSECMQDRRVQVAKMDLAFNGTVAGVAGLSVNVSALNTAAGQPEREAACVVAGFVLPVIGRQARSTKFATAHNERIFQQATMVEVLQ